MNLSGEITVKAPRDTVFNALQDARFFASCIEGVSDLAQTGDNQYDAVFATKVAYMQFRFKVSVELTRIEPPHTIEARVEGTPLGAVGRLTSTSVTRLAEAGDETRIQYAMDVSLTGKLGSLGQPVMRSKAREMEKQFTHRLRAAFEQPAHEGAP